MVLDREVKMDKPASVKVSDNVPVLVSDSGLACGLSNSAMIHHFNCTESNFWDFQNDTLSVQLGKHVWQFNSGLFPVP
jgi:hypothetical protein